MTKIKIVTDSSVTIEPELVKQLDITVVPLSVMIDNVVYSDADLKEEGKFLQLMQARMVARFLLFICLMLFREL